jgi:hypothetical protein
MQTRPEMTTTAMIVMEPGSDWPGQIGDVTNLVAFSQGCDDVLRRTQEKLAWLQRSKQVVRVAVLACNTATGDAAAGHRAQLARMLLGAVSCATRGRLILSASGSTSPGLRQELLALAATLAKELRGSTATVSLRLSEASRRVAARARRSAAL